ncbi:DNA alkylation repair protein [Mycetocola zhadangensis]|uniref:DNA alkylation repair protein n=1 Tax=Mycetocola zhadangensis TaxID=1164595 RepID=UPI003A4D343D
MGTMDDLLSPEVVARLAAAVSTAMPGRELPSLVRAQTAVVDRRLRERVDIVRDALLADLPEGFDVVEALVPELSTSPLFSGWMIWPVTELVTQRALRSGSTEHFDSALELLAQLTVGLTAEFAVRDLLNERPERALSTMRTWLEHEDENVRRLATEGSRAYLPWAKRVPWLIAHPSATQHILNAAYRDPAEYVRRSAANHLNDLSRIDPDLVAATAGRWAEHPDDNTAWVLRSSLRTLVKRGNPEALALLGFSGDGLSVAQPRLSADAIEWGGTVEFTAEVTNGGSSPAVVAIDYAIGFLRANGSVSPKTFKLGSRSLAPGETVVVTKSHSFRPITTRVYYPGAHFITVQANGLLSPPAEFLVQNP